MKTLFLPLSVLLPLLFAACSGSNGTAPVISNFKMESPIATSASTITGSVDVSDPSGLADLSASLAIHGPGVETSINIPVSGSAPDGETQGTIPLVLELGSSIPAGSYSVTLTLSQDGATSNALDATVEAK